MLTSLALTFLGGLLGGYVSKRIFLPSLVGMILAGVFLGSGGLNLMDCNYLGIAPALRQMALVIILLRAGLALKTSELKKVGRPALFLSFLPACVEIGGMLLLAPLFLGVSYIDAAIMGSVVAAVSPAVVVPKMLGLISEKIGTNKQIPQMIMASSSVDDIFVILLFTIFTSLAQGGDFSLNTMIGLPIAVLGGIALGALTGFLFSFYIKHYSIRDSLKVVLLLSISFLLLQLEQSIKTIVPFSALLAIMICGIVVLKRCPAAAERLSVKFAKLWIPAELILFVLVGASLHVDAALKAGGILFVLTLLVLLFRMLGVFLSLSRTQLNFKERLFCSLAFIPKATVQAAIGGVPLAMGLACGELVLTLAVIAILTAAPLGAFAIDLTSTRFLKKE